MLTIVIIAAILRFYRLDTYPALNADEAAIGYNAYSLILTGKDEHGHSWPVHFQSFNDWKPGGYFYFVLPFIKVLGLNELAVRLPNAIVGVLSVIAVYYLSLSLFKFSRDSQVNIGSMSALFLAVSPWHIHYSRGGWEVNFALFLIICGFTLCIKGLEKGLNVKRLLLGASFFVLSIYTYHAARVVVPLLSLGLAAFYYRNIFSLKNIKALLVIFAFSLFLLLPLINDIRTGDVFSRAAGVGLFADKGPINRINEQRGEHGNVQDILAKIVHNKPVNYLLAFMDNWASHYHGEFLFMTGDSIQRNKVPETGQMYLVDIAFLIAGVFWMSRTSKKEFLLVLWWLLVSPVAAALTFQAPHALRSEAMVVPLVIVSAVGASFIWDKLRVAKYGKFAKLVIGIFFVWCVSRYIHQYYSHMSKDYPYSSQYGVKELVQYILTSNKNYKDIVVTTRYDQPYILFLFYLKYEPNIFQGEHSISSRDEYGFSTVREFGPYHFESIDFDQVKTQYPSALIIGTPSEIPKESNIIKRIYGSNNFEYFDLVAN